MGFEHWPHIEALDHSTCWALLSGQGVGRVGLIRGEGPIVLPVNYVVDYDSTIDHNGTIVFSTAAGSLLSEITHRDGIAFEVDHAENPTHGGWSVLARGKVTVIDDPAELERARRLPLSQWIAGAPTIWLRLEVEELTGRRLRTPFDP